MKDLEPLIVRGQHVIQILNSVKKNTLLLILEDLGEMTFVNADVIRIVEKAIINRRKKESFESLETVSVEEPDFWDD